MNLLIGSTERLFTPTGTDTFFGGALKNEIGTLTTGNLEQYCCHNGREGSGLSIKSDTR